MLRSLYQERKFLLGKPWVWLSWLLLTLLVVLAMREGRAVMKLRQAAVQQHSTDVWDTFEERKANAQGVADGIREVKSSREAFENGRVNGIQVPVAIPVSPLQAWSPGLWDSHPTVGSVGVFTAPSDYLELASPRDPESEGWGRLDLTTLVVVLLPLWLLLVFHDTGSNERDRGLFRILEGNGVARRRIIARRWGAPIAMGLIGWTGAFLVGCLITGTWTGVGAAGWQWFGVSLGYGLFWMGFFAWIAACSHSTETSVMGALTAWVAIVILLPGLMDVIIRANSDPAAGVESVSGQRVSAAEAEKERAEVLDKYMFDHPELAGEEEGEFASAFLREYFVTQESVESRIKPVLDRQFAKSEKDLSFVGALSSLVPSAWAQGLMEASAETGPQNMLSFRKQSRDYAQSVRDSLKPFLWSGQLLKPVDFEAVPRFSGQEVAQSKLWAALQFLWLPVLGVIGLALAWRRWMKASVIRSSGRG